MKKFIINIFLLISLIIPYKVDAISTSNAIENIDTSKKGSLSINYIYDDYNFDNTKVKIYQIANISSNFQYELSSYFNKYPIKINGLKTTSELNNLKSTLNSYIETDHIEEFLISTINKNKIEVTNLTPGMYLVKTDKIDTNKYSLLFDTFLVNIPELSLDGTWNYEVNTYPKISLYTPKYETIYYSVTKQWLDDKKNRPSSIDIEIYKDGDLFKSEVLSSSNNWTYEWTYDDDGSTFSVVERNIPDLYNVSIVKNNYNFTIINESSTYVENNPNTSDNIKLYFYLLVISGLGLISLIIGLVINEKN